MATTKKRKRTVQRVTVQAQPEKKVNAKKVWAGIFIAINILVILAGIGAVVYGGSILLLALGLTQSTIVSGLVLGVGLVTALIYIVSGIVAIVIGAIIIHFCKKAFSSKK